MRHDFTCGSLGALLSGALLIQAPVAAQESVAAYPSRTVTVVLPYAAGGPLEPDLRIYLQKLSDSLGKPFVIDYKPGAGTTIGVDFIAKAAPDGYTLGYVASSFGAALAAYPTLSFDPVKDIAPVSLMYKRAIVMLVNPAFPAKTWQEYMAHVRSKPNAVNVGTNGSGGALHLAGAWLHGDMKGDVTFVHYKGVAPMKLDVIAGRVDVMFGSAAGVIGDIRAGKLRPIAVMSRQRSPLLPDLMTISELGIPNFDYADWGGFIAPGRTSPAILGKLSVELGKVVKSYDIVKRAESDGTLLVASSPESFRQTLTSDITRWKKIVQERGIVLEE